MTPIVTLEAGADLSRELFRGNQGELGVLAEPGHIITLVRNHAPHTVQAQCSCRWASDAFTNSVNGNDDAAQQAVAHIANVRAHYTDAAIVGKPTGHVGRVFYRRDANDWVADCSCGFSKFHKGEANARLVLRNHMETVGGGTMVTNEMPDLHNATLRSGNGLHWVECSCGWKSLPRDRRSRAEVELERHVRSPDSPITHAMSTELLTRLLELHQEGNCGDPCVYCVEERRERSRRPASEIMHELELVRDVFDRTEGRGVRHALTYEEGVEAALAWVMRETTFPDPPSAD